MSSAAVAFAWLLVNDCYFKNKNQVDFILIVII